MPSGEVGSESMEQVAKMMLWIRTGGNSKSRKKQHGVGKDKRGSVVVETVEKKNRWMGHDKWNWEASSD